tara:strand:+ start:173 stop:424 length:252 start_codon:yes stop_codon:yes gene_type:complete
MDETKNQIRTLLKKCTHDTQWENEFGGFNIQRLHNKEDYNNGYQILFYANYFKIVPEYFKLPNSHYYWDYYDGIVTENGIIIR